MTLTNAYCTLDEFNDALGIADPYTDSKAERAINGASRAVDAHCNRRFWQDATVATRTYRADDALCCLVDDISTTTGLIVKLDSGGDGSFSDTLTISTHFLLQPYNAAQLYPMEPWNAIEIVDGTGGYFPTGARPGVQVTAKFGWPAVPESVTTACIDHAVKLFKSADAALVGQSSLGQPWALSDYTVGLLEPFVLRR